MVVRLAASEWGGAKMYRFLTVLIVLALLPTLLACEPTKKEIEAEDCREGVKFNKSSIDPGPDGTINLAFGVQKEIDASAFFTGGSGKAEIQSIIASKVPQGINVEPIGDSGKFIVKATDPFPSSVQTQTVEFEAKNDCGGKSTGARARLQFLLGLPADSPAALEQARQATQKQIAGPRRVPGSVAPTTETSSTALISSQSRNTESAQLPVDPSNHSARQM